MLMTKDGGRRSGNCVGGIGFPARFWSMSDTWIGTRPGIRKAPCPDGPLPIVASDEKEDPRRLAHEAGQRTSKHVTDRHIIVNDCGQRKFFTRQSIFL